jgi:hypothetical protein
MGSTALLKDWVDYPKGCQLANHIYASISGTVIHCQKRAASIWLYQCDASIAVAGKGLLRYTVVNLRS